MCHVEDNATRYLKHYTRKGDAPRKPTGVYAFQMPVPFHLHAAYGKPLIEKTLSTREAAVAMTRRDQMESFYLGQFEQIASLSLDEQKRIIAARGVSEFVKTTRLASAWLGVAAGLADAPSPDMDDYERNRAYALKGKIQESREEQAPDLALVAKLQTVVAGNPLAPLRVLESFLAVTPQTGKRGISEETRAMKRRRVGDFATFSNHMPFDHPDFNETAAQWLAKRAAETSLNTANIDASDLEQLGRWVSQARRMFNPCEGLKAKLGRDDDKEHSYSPKETQKMLAKSREFVGGWDADHADALAFLVYSACREGDMIRLRPEDYRPLTQDESDAGHGPAGMMVIDINEEEGTVKKQGRRHTVRLAPCHPELAPVLLAAQQRNAGKGRMFDTVSIGADGERMADKEAVKRYGKRHAALIHRAKVVPGAGRKLNVHSWRHTSWDVAMRTKPQAWTREQWLAFAGKAPADKDYKGTTLKAGDLVHMLATLDLGATGRGWVDMMVGTLAEDEAA